MNREELSLWYLINYKDNLIDELSLTGDNTFDIYKVNVNVYCNEKLVSYNNLINFNKASLCGIMGSGKTYVLLKIIKNIFYKTKRMGIYIDLREYKGEDIFDLVGKTVGCNDISKKYIMEMISKGDICFLFDNYDFLTFNDEEIIKRKIFNNNELKDMKYLIASKKKIENISFSEDYAIAFLSMKKAYKKILRNYCSDIDEFVRVKKHIEKYRLQCFLYKPINLNYLLKISEIYEEISFIYDFKSEKDLYKEYLDALIRDKDIVKIASFIAFYMAKKSLDNIKYDDLKELIAEAHWNYSVSGDVDEIFDVLKDTILIKEKTNNNIYKFSDYNLMMHLVDEYIVNEKLKMKYIMKDKKFQEYLKWRCKIDSKFTYDHIEEFKDEFLYNMLEEIEDEKVEAFYQYILLYFEDKVYKQLKDKLEIIYKRFKEDESVKKFAFKNSKS